MYKSLYKSLIGDIILTSDGTHLTGVWTEGHREFSFLLRSDFCNDMPPVLRKTRDWLDSYFSGDVPNFEISMYLSGTDFQKEVWNILLTIPYGETLTYGEIAQLLAQKRSIQRMSAQAVGRAVGANKISIIIPCHRVIGKDGALVGYAGGLEKKKILLELEKRIV